MKIREKNPVLKELIGDLVTKSFENKAPFWKSVADALNRPNKNHSKVNIFHLERHAKANETLLVPGSVLGTGEIKKPITVAALNVSASAKEKIENAKGSVISINELFEKKSDGKGIRLIG